MRAARLALSVRPNRAKYTLRSKISFAQGEFSRFKKCQDILRLHGSITTQLLLDRNEVSKREEVKMWIPDGRSYIVLKTPHKKVSIHL